jgi:hypothetical protein
VDELVGGAFSAMAKGVGWIGIVVCLYQALGKS